MNILRHPPEDSDDIYPGLSVDDGTVSGSINAAGTRLPLWAIIGTVIEDGWAEANDGWYIEKMTSLTPELLSDFLYELLEARGEFGRLLLLLADVQRVAGEYWFEEPTSRQKMREQLQRCLKTLEDDAE